MSLYQRCEKDLSFPQLIFSAWKVLHTDLANLPSALGAHGSLLCETFQYGGNHTFPNDALSFPSRAPEKGTSP